jgi:nucleoside-diphosphate-sugar epimerase
MGGNRMKIALTGAGGFIGSVVLGYLNKQGIDDIVIFDDLPHADQFSPT